MDIPQKYYWFFPGTVKVWDEGIENNLQKKLMNAPCLQSKDVNWIEVRPNFHRRNLSFCLGLHNCRPFCCTFFQYNLQRASPSNALPWFFHCLEFLNLNLTFDSSFVGSKKKGWTLLKLDKIVNIFVNWFKIYVRLIRRVIRSILGKKSIRRNAKLGSAQGYETLKRI